MNQEKIMKFQVDGLCFALCLSVATALAMAAFTGCAGDRYNRSTGEYIDDKSIDLRVRNALNDNPEYKFGDVNIASFKGAVQLSGFVDSDAEKADAARIAGQVQGVKEVVNNTSVKSTASNPAGQDVDDKTLASQVDTALGNADYKFQEVNVAAFKGTVQLSGFVNSEDQKNQAGEIAGKVSGVQKVVNNITIKDTL
jgi:hyperosmotically inducible periplasmic protein